MWFFFARNYSNFLKFIIVFSHLKIKRSLRSTLNKQLGRMWPEVSQFDMPDLQSKGLEMVTGPVKVRARGSNLVWLGKVRLGLFKCSIITWHKIKLYVMVLPADCGWKRLTELCLPIFYSKNLLRSKIGPGYVIWCILNDG
jgi:hypothetical protein